MQSPAHDLDVRAQTRPIQALLHCLQHGTGWLPAKLLNVSLHCEAGPSSGPASMQARLLVVHNAMGLGAHDMPER